MKRPRVIGTTEEALDRAERELGRKFPPSFRSWLLENNGIGIEQVSIFPVLDDRDVRKTWDSIVREYNVGWMGTLENFEDDRIDFSRLLPFGSPGTDYYCFDYQEQGLDGECPVVRWSHETGETEYRASDFDEFIELLKAGEFDYD